MLIRGASFHLTQSTLGATSQYLPAYHPAVRCTAELDSLNGYLQQEEEAMDVRARAQDQIVGGGRLEHSAAAYFDTSYLEAALHPPANSPRPKGGPILKRKASQRHRAQAPAITLYEPAYESTAMWQHGTAADIWKSTQPDLSCEDQDGAPIWAAPAIAQTDWQTKLGSVGAALQAARAASKAERQPDNSPAQYHHNIQFGRRRQQAQSACDFSCTKMIGSERVGAVPHKLLGSVYKPPSKVSPKRRRNRGRALGPTQALGPAPKGPHTHPLPRHLIDLKKQRHVGGNPSTKTESMVVSFTRLVTKLAEERARDGKIRVAQLSECLQCHPFTDWLATRVPADGRIGVHQLRQACVEFYSREMWAVANGSETSGHVEAHPSVFNVKVPKKQLTFAEKRAIVLKGSNR